MDLVIRPDGGVVAIYGELLDFHALGSPSIRRASHVEPDAGGRWWADLAPVGGPRLGPYALRSAALAAESTWLDGRLPALSRP